MEGFFQKSFSIYEITEIEELLLRRYSNIEYILNLSYLDGIKFIRKAVEKEAEDKLWNIWLENYRISLVFGKKIKDFEEFKKESIKANNTPFLSKKQIENRVEEIINMTL